MKIYAYILTPLLLVLFSGFVGPDSFFYPSFFQKKIDKQIEKSFDTEAFRAELVELDTFLGNLDVFRVLHDEKGEMLGYGIVTLANGCERGGCTLTNKDEDAVYEEFYFSTLYNLNKEIVNVRVLAYDSDYGYAITAKSWLKQFIGKKGGKLRVGKEIDAISGATISVNSIVKEINEQQVFLENSK